ncbi:hypothetical protein KI387_005833, partial [Taxus chinensis]
MNDLNAYVGERDDDEGEELEVDQEPINIHESEGEEVDNVNDAFIFVRKDTRREEGARGEEGSKGASTKEPDVPKLTQEEVDEKETREEEKIIDAFVNEELGNFSDLVL